MRLYALCSSYRFPLPQATARPQRPSRRRGGQDIQNGGLRRGETYLQRGSPVLPRGRAAPPLPDRILLSLEILFLLFISRGCSGVRHELFLPQLSGRTASYFCRGRQLLLLPLGAQAGSTFNGRRTRVHCTAHNWAGLRKKIRKFGEIDAIQFVNVAVWRDFEFEV